MMMKMKVEEEMPETPGHNVNDGAARAGVLYIIRDSPLSFGTADDLAEVKGYKTWAEHMSQALASTNALVDAYDCLLKGACVTNRENLALARMDQFEQSKNVAALKRELEALKEGHIAGSGGQVVKKELDGLKAENSGLKKELEVLKRQLAGSVDNLKISIAAKDSMVAWAETEVKRARIGADYEID